MMAKYKQYKFFVCSVDCPCALEKSINEAARDGWELLDVDLKNHDGSTCWLAIMVKEIEE